MARPIKDGVERFPKDADFYSNYKVRLLRVEFGAKGMYLLDYLLCEIYGKNGYYMQWDKNTCFLVSDGAGCGCSPETVEEFVKGCIRCSFFDKGVYESFGVLTSAGIQRRYIRMFNSRDEINMHEEYLLLNTNNRKDVPNGIFNRLVLKSFKSTGNPNKSTGNIFKSTGNSKTEEKEIEENETKEKKERERTKEKESKERKAKEVKEKEERDKRVRAGTQAGVKQQVPEVPNYLQPEWDEYVKMRKKIKKPLTPYAAKLAMNKLHALSTDEGKQKQILNQSILNSWQGLFELKQQYTNQAQGSDNSGGSWQDFKPSR